MSDERPKFLDCVMTPEIIRAIRAKQETWDREHEKEEK